MNEGILFAVIALILLGLIAYSYHLAEIVTQERVREMARQLSRKSAFELLQMKESLIAGEYDLGAFEAAERIEAINMAFVIKRRNKSTADVPMTPQDGRGI